MSWEAPEQGLIGRWSPGIGDPTFVGWATVFFYFLASFCAYRVATRRSAALSVVELWYWRVLAAGLAALGVNKQLDLQSALTEVGRILAHDQGWYETRREVQRVFILFVAMASLLVAGVLSIVLRHAPRETWLTILGVLGLVGFVAIRAASFHGMDAWLGGGVGGLRWNWVVELGSILVVLAGTLARFARAKVPIVRVRRETTR